MRICTFLALVVFASNSRATTWERQPGSFNESEDKVVFTYNDGTELTSSSGFSVRTLISIGDQLELRGISSVGGLATPVVDPDPIFITYLFGSQIGGPAFTPLFATNGQPAPVTGVPLRAWATQGNVEIGSVETILPDRSIVIDFRPPTTGLNALLNSSLVEWDNLGLEIRSDTTNELIATFDTLSFQYINQRMRNVVPEPSSWVLLLVGVGFGVRRTSYRWSC